MAMHIVPTDPFRPPANVACPPGVVVLDPGQVAHLLTRAFEMLAVTLAVQYDQVDADAAQRAGLTEPVTLDIVSRAVIFGAALVRHADADAVCLSDVWAEDWEQAVPPSVMALEAVPHG